MKFQIRFLICFFCVAFLSACASDEEKIVGKWRMTSRESGPVTDKQYYIFTEDNKYLYNFELTDGTMPAEDWESAYSYQLEGGKVLIQFEIGGTYFTTETYLYEFNGNDQLTLTFDTPESVVYGNKITFEREE
jgi:Lipocalin-like domain